MPPSRARRPLVAARLLAPLLALGLLGSGCFNVTEPACAFRCDSTVMNNGDCPVDYACQADGYCHLKGSMALCPWDGSIVVDMSVPADLVPAPDLSQPADIGDL